MIVPAANNVTPTLVIVGVKPDVSIVKLSWWRFRPRFPQARLQLSHRWTRQPQPLHPAPASCTDSLLFRAMCFFTGCLSVSETEV